MIFLVVPNCLPCGEGVADSDGTGGGAGREEGDEEGGYLAGGAAKPREEGDPAPVVLVHGVFGEK